MMLTDLRARIETLPAVAALARRLAQRPAAEDGQMLHIAPLMGAARPPVLAALASHLGQTLLYVVPDADNALRMVGDLRQWLPDQPVLLYPANDTLPYETMAPAAGVRSQRLQVVQALVEHSAPLVVVAPIKALLQPTLSPQEWRFAQTPLKLNERAPQNTLLQRWVELGYRVVPMVEEAGDLARRGGIVDIWPAADEQPLRIEWFGDEIDSLRRFDVANQRSEQRLQRVTIGPPYELPFWQYQQALERLQKLDTGNLRAEVHEEWQHLLTNLEMGGRFEGWALLAPFFRAVSQDERSQQPVLSQACSLLCHLPADGLVLLSEARLIGQIAAEFHEQAEEQRMSLVAGGELPPAFPRPYLLWEELLEQAGGRVLADVSSNEALPPPESQHFPHEGAPVPLRSGSNADEPLFVPADLFGGQLRRLIKDIVARLRAGEEVAVVTAQAARIQELISEMLGNPEEAAVNGQRRGDAGRLLVMHGALDAGWRLPDARLTLYTDAEIFGWRQRRPQSDRQRLKERSSDDRAAFLRGLKPGDYVVHIEHGIAVYEGLLRRTVADVEREYLNLRYAGGDRLYVPVDQVDRVTRYVGTGDATPPLTRLGTQEWERAKRKARAAVQDLADDLLKLYAQRQTHNGYAFAPDNEWQRELEDSFPYIETDDQLHALQEIKQDMESPQPMDRLMCGDVGFGKTEVALRATFKAVQDGKQVAILVPTTVLAQQHYNTFRQRMEPFPVTVEMLSRFRSTRAQEEILQRLRQGGIDIIIGTHRLLSKDVHFKDLGLLIVDEEQRFGVRHKERLKQMRAEVDVLTLTATPIPRTLHMALAGIRDMSVISTPPEDRIPIKTYVMPYEDALIRDAIRREMDRGGQVYFLHNRVQSIYHVAARLRHLVPEADIGVAHGQLDERQLERTMLDFFNGTHDVLVCTTIIENGLDLPNANTMIIDDAPMYGLAQLYQLRGRIGRSANRAYAYLLYKHDKPMTQEAHQRLQAIQEATELGSGFRIAMRDLEIRGAGNLLGAEQSGHIAAVGFDLYSRLLEQAVQQLKQRIGKEHGATDDEQRAYARQAAVVHEKVLVSPLVTLDLPLTAYLPEAYIPDEDVRLRVYQRMVEVQSPQAVQELRRELRDRFGELPDPAAHLLIWLHIKALALEAGVRSVVTTDEEFVIRLPVMNAPAHDRIRRHFQRTHDIRVGPQFMRLDRRGLDGDWVEKLVQMLEVLRQTLAEQPHQRARRAHR